MNKLFVLPFENIADWTGHIGYYFPKVEIKDHSIMIHGRDVFDQAVKNEIRTYENIWKFATDQGDDYNTIQ